ncbi:MAG: hypothetical protein C0478_18650 [Planctomyces sp.]|nr:hypothetical protein [Planctomyces sp.]
MREGFLHASWILALGMGWSISSLAEEQPPAERVHRPAATSETAFAVSALDIDNSPELLDSAEKLFVRHYLRVLDSGHIGMGEVVEFQRMTYHAAFETEARERGFLYVADDLSWMMATQPWHSDHAAVSHKKGRSGTPYRLVENRAHFISMTQSQLVFADKQSRTCEVLELPSDEPYGFCSTQQSFRLPKKPSGFFPFRDWFQVSRHPQAILFCWPFARSSAAVESFSSHWTWSLKNEAGPRIHLLAQPREATRNAGFSYFELMIDRSLDRIVAIKVGDPSDSIETVYVEVSRKASRDQDRTSFLRGLGLSRSEGTIPAGSDFRRAGFRLIGPPIFAPLSASAQHPINSARKRSVWTRDYDQMSHPVYYQPPVSALRPLNMPDPHERSAWNLMWRFGLALGRWPAAGLFRHAAGLGT